MAVRLIWLPLAKTDFRDSVAYIRRDNPPAALVFAKSLLERVELLRDFPEIGHEVEGIANPGMREIGYRNYRIIYRYLAANAKVEIVRLWHAARANPTLD